MKSKDSLAPSCVLVVFPVRPKCPDGVAPQAHVNGRKRVCCTSIRHDSMLRGKFRAMQAASFGTRPRHDRLRVSGASSEHSAMQKRPPPFYCKQSTHAHTAESRACGGPWSHLCLVGTLQWGRTHGTQAAKGTEEKRALLVLVKWARVYTAHAIRYGNTQAALCFFVKRRATLKKKSRLRRTSWGMPPDPPGARISLLLMGRGG